MLAAAGAAVPVTALLLLLSGFDVSPQALAFCLVVSALPAGLAALALDRRHRLS